MGKGGRTKNPAPFFAPLTSVQSTFFGCEARKQMQTAVVLAVPTTLTLPLIKITDVLYRVTVVSNTSEYHYAPHNLEMSVLGGPAAGFCSLMLDLVSVYYLSSFPCFDSCVLIKLVSFVMLCILFHAFRN